MKQMEPVCCKPYSQLCPPTHFGQQLLFSIPSIQLMCRCQIECNNSTIMQQFIKVSPECSVYLIKHALFSGDVCEGEFYQGHVLRFLTPKCIINVQSVKLLHYRRVSIQLVKYYTHIRHCFISLAFVQRPRQLDRCVLFVINYVGAFWSYGESAVNIVKSL